MYSSLGNQCKISLKSHRLEMSTENYCFWSASIRWKAISNWDFCSNTCCLSSVSLPISGSVCISASLTLQENDVLPSALSANSTESSFAELTGTSSVKSTDETFNLRAALLGGISKFRAIGSFLLRGNPCEHGRHNSSSQFIFTGEGFLNLTWPEVSGAYFCSLSHFEVLPFISSYSV